MSRRVKVFKAANIVPQTTCNYTVLIPSIWRSPVAVEATKMPFKKTTSSSIYIRGVNYQIPVKQTAQGSWTCIMTENAFMGSLYQGLNQFYRAFGDRNGENNMLFSFGFQDIYIFITDALTGVAPVAACVLKDCYLTDMQEIPLNAKGATEVMKVQLTFQYNDILDPIKTAEWFVGVAKETAGMKSANLTDGSLSNIATIEAWVTAITAGAWGANWAADKGLDKIEDLLQNG